MFQKILCLFSLQLLISAVSMEKTNRTIDAIYSKFHQNDYNLDMNWAEAIRFTKPELKDFKISVFKYNRTCAVGNLTVHFTIPVGNELELVVQLYKFASNEFRLFPARFQVNFCKALANNLIGSAKIITCGNFTGCPLLKGQTYHICNWAPDQSQFPPFIPTGQFMVEIQALYRNKELFLTRNYGTVSRPIVW